MSDYIQLTNISKTFGKQTVLQPLTMGFEEGMIHGIIGRNGSGKTVLMKMILGILQPTTGTVIVGDKRIGKDVDFPESAGAIIETIEFIPYMSAYQNLADIAAMHGNLSKTQIKEVLEMVGLGNVGRKHVSKFSMGMRQRLAIAQAVMESPKILILDEPMNGMDEKGVEEMRRLILARKAAGTTIILSSHNIEDIRILCDQVYRIDAGVVMREVE
jgi:ABC-2 type transport system ATP-binding protein